MSITQKHYPVYRKMRTVSAFCPRCACAMDRMVIPAEYRKLKCPECGVIHYSSPRVIGRARACRNCLKIFDDTWLMLELEDWEAVPSRHICEDCKDEISVFDEEVQAGGVTWHCGGCGSSGVFPHDNPVAKQLRDMENVRPPHSLGVQLQGGCPVCNGDIAGAMIDEMCDNLMEIEHGQRNRNDEEPAKGSDGEPAAGTGAGDPGRECERDPDRPGRAGRESGDAG